MHPLGFSKVGTYIYFYAEVFESQENMFKTSVNA